MEAGSGKSQNESLKLPSYPSNCLYFLRSIEDSVPESARNGEQLNVVIVGAGLGGLATAIALAQKTHHVTIYEQAHQLAEVGAGIQIPPNSTRLLLKLGLGPYLEKYVTEPESVLMRRWQNGKVIGRTRLDPDFKREFDAPYWVIHRAHFHEAMHALAVDLGVVVNLASKVVSYDVDGPTVSLENGSTIFADLIVAADGVNSTARRIVQEGVDHPPQKTGFAAYRAVVDIGRMLGDPEIAWLLEKPSFNLWLGDKRHVMTYVIGAGKTFNMVLSHPDDGSGWDTTEEETIANMRKEFEGWDPVLTKIIKMIDKTLKWPLFSGTIMNRWISGKLVVLGDAAHAMLPYMSQGTKTSHRQSIRNNLTTFTNNTGAAIAVEDGVALAQSLDRITSKAQIPRALSIFEGVRVKRANQMQEASLLQGKLWHFADGPVQKARDAAMSPEVEGRPFSHSPNQWSDPATQMWCYAYNAEKEIDQEWDRQLGKGGAAA
ncbi:hypothetical protein N7476_010606, partial [Penicillium atrosanguineum]